MKITKSYIPWILFLGFLFFFPIIYSIDQNIGISIFGLLSFYVFLTRKYKYYFPVIRINKNEKNILSSLYLFTVWYFLCLLINFDLKGLYHCILLLFSTLIFTIIVVEKPNFHNSAFVKFGIFFWLGLMCTLLVVFTFLSTDTTRSAIIYPHRNSGAFLSFICFSFVMMFDLKKIYKALYLVLCFLLIYHFDSRAIILSLLVWFMTYIIMCIPIRKIWASKVTIYTVLGFIAFITWFIASGVSINEYKYVDDFFRSFSGGGINSGRHLIWPEIIQKISNSPYLGNSPGITPPTFIDTEWSSHSLYLNIVLQVGLIGLFLLVKFYFEILKEFVITNDKVGICFLMVIIIHQGFNVSLFQNNFDQGLLYLILLGLLLARNKKIGVNLEYSINR